MSDTVLFRNGLVLTMDDSHTVLPNADVLVVDDRIAEVGEQHRRIRPREDPREVGHHESAEWSHVRPS